ncbi:MAG: glycosyltransferase family 1 protein, partial [Prevotellaceae bacterium]|nr:glycosyltransferase family 1 protein [Prevotellaceae bacterium]
MNIGFDAKRAIQNNTGLGNYSRYVIEILSKYYPANNYILFAPRRKENSRLDTILSRTNISFVFPRGIA